MFKRAKINYESPTRSQAVRECLYFLPQVVVALAISYDYTIEGAVEIEIPFEGRELVELCLLSHDRLLAIVDVQLLVWDIKTGNILMTKDFSNSQWDEPSSIYAFSNHFVVVFLDRIYGSHNVGIYDSTTFELLTHITCDWENSDAQELYDGTIRIVEGQTAKLGVVDFEPSTGKEHETNIVVNKNIERVICLPNKQILVLCLESPEYSIDVFSSLGGTSSKLCTKLLPQREDLKDLNIVCTAPLDDGMVLGGSASKFGYIVLFKDLQIVSEILTDGKEVNMISVVDSGRVACGSGQEVAIWNLSTKKKEIVFTGAFNFPQHDFKVLPDFQLVATTFAADKPVKAIEAIDSSSHTSLSIATKVDDTKLQFNNLIVLPHSRLICCYNQTIMILR